MPSTLPSSFASAAAGNTADNQARAAAARGDASFVEWSRRPNGATQTFRRSSSAMTNTNTAHSREPSNTLPAAPAYVSAHLAQGRNGAAIDTRYSKSQLLDLYREQQEMGDLDTGLDQLFVGDWDPGYINGGSSGSKWTRGQDAASDMAPGPETCFERSHEMSIPSGLFEMSDEERELFTSSVNSTLKGPNQNPGQRDGPGARKISLSTGTQPLNSVNSPTSGRPLNRRRETAESQSITSPRAGRDDNPPASPPPSLMRRRTDLRDAMPEDRPNSVVGAIGAPMGSLKRSSTQPFGASPSNPASPWSAAPAGNPMGSFGNFAIGNAGRPGMGARGESRFRGLMSRESAEEMGARSSMSNLGRLDEAGSGTLNDEGYNGQGHPIGSAALGGDSPPPGSAYPEYNTPARQRPGLNAGLSGLGGDISGAGAAAGAGFPGQNQYGSIQASSQPSQQPHAEPMSPTYTNPYQSPEHIKHRLEDGESEEVNDSNNFHLPGLGGYRQDGPGNPAAFNARMANANFGDVQGFDRGSTSSATGHRGFPGLVGLGGLGGLGGQDTSLRSPATMQSPALAGLGGASFSQPSAPGSQPGSIRGNSRLGSLFPSGMQDQMRSGGRPLDAQSEDTDENSGSLGNTAFTPGQHPHRDTDSPFRTGRGKFEDFFAAGDKQDPSLDAFMRAQMGGQAAGAPGQSGPQRMPSNVGSTGSSQPPAPQQKTMVMPDRIRWIYRDPQGNTQGPWSGLEMHDWYRAGFFSPELLVKKVEDPDYEPLAQLIRRIGNSREPFLVPQIGIPGPPSSQGGWPNQHPAPGPANPGAQPPFAGSFPSFGTTLTAEQQNALERRKQEEQYLMARQKEHLAQQQFLVKQLQMQGHISGYSTSGLQHHSSANSLHSQPSYGSITSPSGFQPTPMAAPGSLSQGSSAAFAQGFDGNAFRGTIGSGLDSLGDIKEEDLPGLMNRLGVGAPGAGTSGQGSQDNIVGMQSAGSAAFAERARLQQEAAEQAAHEGNVHSQVHGDGQRLKQFQALQQDQMHAELKHEDDLSHEPHDDDDFDHIAEPSPQQSQAGPADRDLTLTEQVQKAASAKHSPANTSGVWGVKTEHSTPTTVAPPKSSSPLPAPAARRKHGNMADQLDIESVGPSGSPSVETPTTSVAPWATQAAEAQKQPSLKEIQEAEARRAAKREELNQAARRAALEREIAASQATAAASAPGLPSSSTWGSGSVEPSPTTATNAPWAKINGGKTTPSAATKKTLQQIQKEEEAKKNKIMAAAAINVQASSAAQLAAGKRTADFVGKSGSPISTAAAGTVATGGTGAWTTVGAGGRAKPPPAPAAPVLQRTASSNLGRTVSASVHAKPVAPVRANTVANTPASATESLYKWAVAELRPDLNKGLTPEGFVDDLMNLGTDTGLIMEAVHQSSQTIDSRHFASEFVRRRMLADKGKTVEAAGPVSTTSAASGAGGWSEVARKGPAKTGVVDDSDAAFKVVAAKKKGGRK